MLVHWKGEPASSASWEDVESFVARYPHFQLEDELLVEGGRDVMWGRVYRRRSNAQGVQGPTDAAGSGAQSRSNCRDRFLLSSHHWLFIWVVSN